MTFPKPWAPHDVEETGRDPACFMSPWQGSDKNLAGGNSLAVQWLGLCAFTAEDLGSIPGWGTKIPQVVRHGQKKFIYLFIIFFFRAWDFLIKIKKNLAGAIGLHKGLGLNRSYSRALRVSRAFGNMSVCQENRPRVTPAMDASRKCPWDRRDRLAILAHGPDRQSPRAESHGGTSWGSVPIRTLSNAGGLLLLTPHYQGHRERRNGSLELNFEFTEYLPQTSQLKSISLVNVSLTTLPTRWRL